MANSLWSIASAQAAKTLGVWGKELFSIYGRKDTGGNVHSADYTVDLLRRIVVS